MHVYVKLVIGLTLFLMYVSIALNSYYKGNNGKALAYITFSLIAAVVFVSAVGEL